MQPTSESTPSETAATGTSTTHPAAVTTTPSAALPGTNATLALFQAALTAAGLTPTATAATGTTTTRPAVAPTTMTTALPGTSAALAVAASESSASYRKSMFKHNLCCINTCSFILARCHRLTNKNFSTPEPSQPMNF